MKKLLVVVLLLLAFGTMARAQKCAVGTNVLDWANLATVNANVDYAISRHLSLVGEARWNGVKFKDPDPLFLGHRYVENKKFQLSAGVKYWPWYVFSGLNIGAKAFYKSYQNSGMFTDDLETGKRAALGLSVGYSFMITKHINIEVGVGGFAGYNFQYARYDCPCPECVEKGPVDLTSKLSYGFDRVLISGAKAQGPGFAYGLENIYLTLYYIFL